MAVRAASVQRESGAMVRDKHCSRHGGAGYLRLSLLVAVLAEDGLEVFVAAVLDVLLAAPLQRLLLLRPRLLPQPSSLHSFCPPPP